MIKLDIFSDPICPWCYIGKAFLDKALFQHPDHPFTIEWHPFQLNPKMPQQGMDRHQYLEAKFGGQRGVIEAYKPVLEHAQSAGLNLNLASIQTTPNTLDAHRLMYWAGLEDCQSLVADLLFKAYFEQGLNIGAHDILLQIADTAKLNVAAIERLLSSDDDKDTIKDRDNHNRHIGVKSAPTYIVARQNVVTGAQPTDLWSAVIHEIQEQLEAPQ